MIQYNTYSFIRTGRRELVKLRGFGILITKNMEKYLSAGFKYAD